MTTKVSPALVGRKFLHMQDQKVSGTTGGTGSTGSWFTRVLNTKVTDTIGSTLASNTFTLPPGTYEINITVPGWFTAAHKARLYNVTDSTVSLEGSSEYSRTATDATQSDSKIYGIITIGAMKTFRVEQRVSDGTTNNLGIATSFGTEIYTNVIIERIA